MAGKRQHYIPRFLQRGFLAAATREDRGKRTWLHVRGRAPKLTGTRDIGVQDYFYSRPRIDGAPTLDDLITQIETVFEADLIYASQAPLDTELDRTRAARLVSHLVLRTAYVRSAFANAATQVVEGIVDIIGTREGARSHFRVDDPTVDVAPSPLVTAAVEALASAGVDMPPQLTQRVVSYSLRERFDEVFAGIEAQMVTFQQELSRRLSSVIANAHNDVLAKDTQGTWEHALATLSWRSVSVDSAVLPDCIAIAGVEGGEWTPLLLAGLGDVERCIVPIQAGRALVGTRNLEPMPAIEALNHALVSCSDRFFISPLARSDLAGHIGQRSAEAIAATVQEALSALGPGPSPITGDAVTRQVREGTGSMQFQYSLNLPALEHMQQTQALETIVTAVVREQAGRLPLENLDGITFAIDYAAALAALDRGESTLTPDLSESRQYGTPVAKCVTVMRGGLPKNHLVFGAQVALMLLSDAEDDQRYALHILVSMLAYVVHDLDYQRPFEARQARFLDPTTGLMYRAVGPIPGQYYTARESAFAYPAGGQAYAELFRDSMAVARAEIDAARLDYRVSGDLDALVDASLLHLRHALSHAAQWLGHRDGRADDDIMDETMRNTVNSWDLARWLDLLGDDLRTLYDPAGDYPTARIFGLTRHVERLLWVFQIFPWTTEDGLSYVTVPMGNDGLRRM